MEIPDPVIYSAVASTVLTVVGGIKVAFAWWTHTIEKKDAKIEDLSIQLSKKSDQSAAEIKDLNKVIMRHMAESADARNALTERVLAAIEALSEEDDG